MCLPTFRLFVRLALGGAAKAASFEKWLGRFRRKADIQPRTHHQRGNIVHTVLSRNMTIGFRVCSQSFMAALAKKHAAKYPKLLKRHQSKTLAAQFLYPARGSGLTHIRPWKYTSPQCGRSHASVEQSTTRVRRYSCECLMDQTWRPLGTPTAPVGSWGPGSGL